jgi:GT2 family glycosyltransferase
MNVTKIAVLLTCHNRKLKTLACLSALFAQTLPEKVEVCVYLVDDGSTDGTEEAVRQTYPQVKVFQGDGNLFWNGGMRIAWTEAMKYNYDYYLWLNDDTILYPQALSLLLSESHRLAKQGESRAILVGSTQEPDNGTLSYGGLRQVSWVHPLQFQLIEPSEDAQPCDTMNGNCVLIPREVVQLVGSLDSVFIHNLADYDYGLRARRKGCSIWLVPSYVGTCSSHLPAWRERSLTWQERLKEVNHPKGLLLKEWKVFAIRHAGLFWPIYWLLPYRKLFFP